MLEELHTASSLLCTALDRYVRACSALGSGLSHEHLINKVGELSDIMENEIDLVESYKSKLTQAQVAVKRARNDQADVPINLLPPEVLVKIFYLVLLGEEPHPIRKRHFWESKDKPYFPDILSHVCSRWRQIALSSPQLWAYIDIALSCSRSKGSHDRAVAHVSRARQVPLDIYFIDPGHIVRPETTIGSDGDSEEEYRALEIWNEAIWDSNPDMFHFLASPDSRIRSLRLDVRYQYHPIHSRALEHCLAKCLPGSLSELAIKIHTPLDDAFFQVRENVEDRDTTELVISEQTLERVLSSITVLNLEGAYFPWTSTAYHRLTELQLFGTEDISALELTSILKSSPGLHTIRCNLGIVDLPNSSIIAVALPELEILELDGMFKPSAKHFIKLLNPGPKPLRLSLSGNPTSAMLRAFFQRLNVQELRVRADRLGDGPRLSPKAFYLPPQLRVLVMGGWHWDTLSAHGEEIPPTQLDTVYMLECRYPDTDLFQKTVAHFSPRRLVLWNCRIGKLGKWRNSLSVFRSALGKDLSGSCSLEYLTGEDPNPVPDWTYIDT